MNGDSESARKPDPMPDDVRLASDMFGHQHNTEIASFLALNENSTFGQIHNGLQDRGVEMVKGTLSYRLRTMEAAGIIVGNLPPEQRGRGKVVRYSLVPSRLQSLLLRQLDYMLGLLSSESEPRVTPVVDDETSPLGPVNTQILHFLSKNSPATFEEIQASIGRRATSVRLEQLAQLRLVVMSDDGTWNISRSGVTTAVKSLFDLAIPSPD